MAYPTYHLSLSELLLQMPPPPVTSAKHSVCPASSGAGEGALVPSVGIGSHECWNPQL